MSTHHQDWFEREEDFERVIIDTADFRALEGISQATLTQNAKGASSLALSWVGYGPTWLRRKQPVTVMHRGKVLFHGRIRNFSRSNDAGAKTATATVEDVFWLLDDLPLGAQVAEIEAGNASTPVDMGTAGQEALRSWADLAKSCEVVAPLWVVSEAGLPLPDAIVTLDVSQARFSAGCHFKIDHAVTAWTAMIEMQSANPDAFYRYDPTTGKVHVVSMGAADIIVWDTERMRILSCNDISPQYDNSVTGVCLVVSYNNTEAGLSGSARFLYPEDIDPGQQGIKIVQATVNDPMQLQAQAAYLLKQIKSYYEAVNVLQYGGSVTALMDDVPESPLACRLNITGPDTFDDWHTMDAIVTSVEWDFLAGTVMANIGAQFDEPAVVEMEFPEGGDLDDDQDRDETTTGSGSGSKSPWMPPPGGGGGDGDDDGGDGGDDDSFDRSDEDFSTIEDWDYTDTEGGEDPGEKGSEDDGGGSKGEQGSQGTAPGTGTDTGTGTGTGSQGGCDCSEMLEAIRREIERLDKRIDEIKQCECEHGTGTGTGTGGGAKPSTPGELQKVFNALIDRTLFGRGSDASSFWYKESGLFPDWYKPGMTDEEFFKQAGID